MRNQKIKNMVGIAILMAIVVVLQLVGQYIRFGAVSISLVLLPVVVGAAVYGPIAGVILGLAGAVVVLAQPDTAFFYGMGVFGTVVIVLLKGMLSGGLAGLTYRAVAKKSSMLAVTLSAVVCPVVNTGIFILGCMVFFYDNFSAASDNVLLYVVATFAGLNFLVELLINILCCPMIVRLLHILQKRQ